MWSSNSQPHLLPQHMGHHVVKQVSHTHFYSTWGHHVVKQQSATPTSTAHGVTMWSSNSQPHPLPQHMGSPCGQATVSHTHFYSTWGHHVVKQQSATPTSTAHEVTMCVSKLQRELDAPCNSSHSSSCITPPHTVQAYLCLFLLYPQQSLLVVLLVEGKNIGEVQMLILESL